jgi:hypothetical protein
MGFLGPLLSIIWLVCAIWVIYDVVMNHHKMSQSTKIIWIVAAVLFGPITAIVYYFMVKKK